MKHVVLIGFMGAGKTAIGKRLAKALGRSFVDLDAYIEAGTGQSIPEIFKSCGQDGFRRLEGEYALAASQGDSKVIATGGGFVTVDDNVQVLRSNSTFVYLKVDPEVGYERVSRTAHRPLLRTENPKATYMALLKERLPFYGRYADITVESTRGPFDKVLRDIQTALKERDA